MRGLPELPDLEKVEMARAAVKSILDRYPVTLGMSKEVWAERLVLEFASERLEALKRALDERDHEESRRIIRALERKAA